MGAEETSGVIGSSHFLIQDRGDGVELTGGRGTKTGKDAAERNQNPASACRSE